jgi:uncharacterized protein (DUF1800 family)
MSMDAAAAIAANRFGLGAKPGDLDVIGADPRGWLDAQLRAGPPLLTAPGLNSTAQVLREADALIQQRREQRQARSPAAVAPAVTPTVAPTVTPEAVKRLRQLYRSSYVADVQARMRNAVSTPRPFVERLVYFWSNHFAVSVDKNIVAGIAGSLEREAIRPHALGNFHELLLAVEQHPAMLLYLDNQRSVGPDSEAAQRAARRDRTLGLNENLAREILELHTLGVDGGYTQADVTSFAKVLTGWSVGGGAYNRQSDQVGEFLFRAQVHEPGAQSVFRRQYDQSDMAQGEAVFKDLAVAPATARHIATKLARHFIADDPPPAAVARIAKAFERSGGDLPTVYRAVIASQEVWQTPQTKFKTPQDYVLSVYRALDLPVEERAESILPFFTLGQRQFAPGSPAGWPDRSDDWDGASALMKRIEYADALSQRLSTLPKVAELGPQLLGATYSEDTRTSIARAASDSQALTLLLTAPEFLRR